MDIQQQLDEILQHPERPIDQRWVLDVLDRYPSFFFPAALLIKRNGANLTPDMLKRLRLALVTACPDKTALANFADIAGTDWKNIYPPETLPQERSTELTIDTFINTYGGESTHDEEALLERLIFTPAVPDYFAGTDEPYNPNDPLELPPELKPGYKAPAATHINIAKTAPQPEPEAKPKPEQPKPQPETKPEAEKTASKAQNERNEPSLMESLAKFFIKQRRYERAYEIISKLSLNYPEKSVYFADQLRFLQKLIENQRYLDNKKTKNQE